MSNMDQHNIDLQQRSAGRENSGDNVPQSSVQREGANDSEGAVPSNMSVPANYATHGGVDTRANANYKQDSRAFALGQDGRQARGASMSNDSYLLSK